MRIIAAQLAKKLIGNDTDALVQPLAEHTNFCKSTELENDQHALIKHVAFVAQRSFGFRSRSNGLISGE